MMVNRNLINLVRSVSAARSLCINTIKPINRRRRLYSKKSSSSRDKGVRDPGQDESTMAPTYDSEPPLSKFPPASVCCDEIKSNQTSCCEPEPLTCPKPLNPPCTTSCDKPEVCEKKKSNWPLILLLLAVVIAAGVGYYLYEEHKKSETPSEPPPSPSAPEEGPAPTQVELPVPKKK